MLVSLLESSQPFAPPNTIIEQHERDLHSLFGRIHTALGAIALVFMRYWTEEIGVSGRRLQQVEQMLIVPIHYTLQ